MKINILNYLNSGTDRSIKVKQNIIGALFIKGLSIVVQLLLVPLTLGYVSSELYGVWLTLSSMILWINFFDVGFTLGLKNRLAEALAQNDKVRGRHLVSTTYVMMIAIFLPLTFILIGITPFVNWANFLSIDESYNREIAHTLIILFSCFGMQMIANVLTAVIAAYQKVALSNAFPVIGNILSLVAIFLLTKFASPSLVYLACATSSMPIIVVLIASLVLYSNKFKEVSPRLSCFDKREIKNIFSLGVKFFIIQIQVVVLYQTANILISNVSGPNEVTVYNIAYKYLSVGMMVFNVCLQPLWPAFTDAYTKGDYKWMNSVYRKLSKLYGVAFACIVFMVLISPPVYKIWVGDSVSVPWIMTVSIAIYMLIHMWDSLQVLLINGIGTVRIQTWLTTVGLIVYIPIALAIGHYMGTVGIVISMTIVNILYATVFTIQIRKILNQTAKGAWLK